jgi:hypothetical protein
LRKTFILTAVMATALLAGVGSANAAGIIDARLGGVTLNHAGKGFKPVTGKAKVAVGDAIMVAPDKTAVLVYDMGGCRVPVTPGTVVVVQFVPPCAVGAVAAAAAGAAGAGGAAAGGAAAAAASIATPGLIVAGVAGAAGATVVAADAGLLEGIVDLSFIGIGPKPISP